MSKAASEGRVVEHMAKVAQATVGRLQSMLQERNKLIAKYRTQLQQLRREWSEQQERELQESAQLREAQHAAAMGNLEKLRGGRSTGAPPSPPATTT
ncbi:MAG: hypothetical protein AAF368_05115, partial [Planctomycetota bacterium]